MESEALTAVIGVEIERKDAIAWVNIAKGTTTTIKSRKNIKRQLHWNSNDGKFYAH